MVRNLINNFHFIFNWLYASAPAFPCKGEQISVLYKPEEFYECLLNRCSQATSRIVMASLYLGTGDKEQCLVDTIMARAHEMGKEMKVKILLDSFRGSRGEDNSRKMLLPLLRQNPNSQVALYRTPKLGPFLRKILPQRYNELVGLQHMKIYIVDDDVLISGANLSQDYFTNRQDRYVLIKDHKKLADFLEEVVTIVGNASLQLNKNNTLSALGTAKKDEGNHQFDIEAVKEKMINHFAYHMKSFKEKEQLDSGYDTWIFPTVEIPPCSIHFDSQIVNEIIENSLDDTKIHFATGYFNLNEDLKGIILNSTAVFDILVAHPTANGFYQSKGFSQYIPEMYTILTEQFLQKIQLGEMLHVRIHEYRRPNWTFHGKGIWMTPDEEETPQLTVVGSSNYGARSKERDLECQLVILTSNQNLRKQLHEEQKRMYHYATPFNYDILAEEKRKPRAWLSYVVKFVRSYF